MMTRSGDCFRALFTSVMHEQHYNIMSGVQYVRVTNDGDKQLV